MAELPTPMIEQLLAAQGTHWQPTEWMVQHTYRHLLRPGENAIDGGALVGMHAEGMARVTQTGTVLTFEPNPDILPKLRKNLAESGQGNIQLIEAAIGSEPSTAVFYSHREHPALSGLEIAPGRHEAEYTTSEVSIVSLDQASDHLSGPLGFIKLDLEGHELPALQGAFNTLRKHRPFMTFEYGHAHAPLEGEADIFAYLKDIGYAVHDPFFRAYDGDYWRVGEYRAKIFPMNFVAIPLEKLALFEVVTLRIAEELPTFSMDSMWHSAATNFRTPATDTLTVTATPKDPSLFSKISQMFKARSNIGQSTN